MAGGGATASKDNLLAALGEGGGGGGVGEKASGFLGGGGGVGDDDDALGGGQSSNDFTEVLMVGANDGGLAEGDRLDGVRSTPAIEAATNDDDVGEGVDFSKLAHGVNQEAPGSSGGAAFGSSETIRAKRAADDTGHERGDFVETLGLAGDDDNLHARVEGRQKGVKESALLVFAGGAENDYGARAVDAHGGGELVSGGEQGLTFGLGADGSGGVPFHGVQDVQAIGGDAHFAEVGGVGLILSADGGESGEGGAHEGLDQAVATDAALAQASINDGDRDGAARTFLDHVGPDFQLDRDEEVRLDGVQEAADSGGEVERVAEDGVVLAIEGDGAGKAGVGGGGDDKFEVGQGSEATDEVLDEVDFADADGVEEDAPVPRKFRQQRFGVTESAAPVGAPFAGAEEAVTPNGTGDDGGKGVSDIARERHGGDCTAGARRGRAARLTLHGGHRSQHVERAVGA